MHEHITITIVVVFEIVLRVWPWRRRLPPRKHSSLCCKNKTNIRGSRNLHYRIYLKCVQRSHFLVHEIFHMEIL